MLQELPHQSFAFQISDISFILKFYAVRDDFQKIMPVVDLRMIQGDKTEEATGYRIRHLRFLDFDSLNAIHHLYYALSSKEDEGYAPVRIRNIDIDYYLIENYFLRFVDLEDGYSGVKVIEGIGSFSNHSEWNREIFICKNVHLKNFAKSIEGINNEIRNFFTKHNYWDTFYDKYSYDRNDPNHRELQNEPEIVKVNVNEIHPGPIRHNELPEIWHNEALSIYHLISEVEDSSFEHFEENFRRDLNYEKEITIWRCIATAYNTFVTARMIISLSEKKSAYKIAVCCSCSFGDENDVKGDELISDDDAKFIYKIYRLMISQTFSNRRKQI